MSRLRTELHEKHQFGIMYPSNVHGVGSPSDLLAYFDAVQLVSEELKIAYPMHLSLRQQPVWGKDMLQLFDEAKRLQFALSNVKTTDTVLSHLKLLDRETKLKTKESTLAGVFSRVIELLSERAPGFVKAMSEYPEDTTLETGSVRVGPVEPLVPSRFFKKLPASAFDDADPPLWLRDEIFDKGFYAGKI